MPGREALRVEAVLAALNHPLRLRIVRTLAAGDRMSCREVLPDVRKSSASHHWRVLREGGVVEQRREGRRPYPSLRREDLDARFPGLLDAVIRG